MRYLGWLITLLALVIAPNLIWLATSSVKIHNVSNLPISNLSYSACDKTHAIGNLLPGESSFKLLQACGDDTLEIHIGVSKFCQTYVEGELYHIDVLIKAPSHVECRYDDLLSSLYLVKAFL